LFGAADAGSSNAFIIDYFGNSFNVNTGIQAETGTYVAGPLSTLIGNFEGFWLSAFTVAFEPLVSIQ
jgi:hypothetical protein